MEKKPAPQLLRVPLPSKTQAQVCQPTVRAMTQWLADLPKANLGETAKLLYQVILELNELVLSNEERLHLLELLRPEVFNVCRNLERFFLGQSIILDERAHKVANLCQTLQTHLAVGYKLLAITELRNAHPDLRILALALQRSLYGVYQILIRASQLYHPIPEGLWLELHQLYQAAERQHLTQQVLDEPQAHGQTLISIEHSYLLSLLLGCAQTNQIRQTDIARLSEALEHWVALVDLHTTAPADGLFVVHPKYDNGPRYRALQSYLDPQSLFTVNTQALTDAIAQYLLMPAAPNNNLHVPQYFSQDLLKHLACAWGEIAERTFQRSPAQGERSISIGMSAVHYFCAGKRSFAELLKRKTVTKPVYEEKERVDIWAKAIDVQHDSWSIHADYDGIPFNAASPEEAEPEAAAEAYPTYSLTLVNVSPTGYCLAWLEELPSQLQTGELLGIEDGGSYGIAVVRWIRQIRGGGAHMGVELLAPRAYPCALKLLRNGDTDSVYLRALLLPEVDTLSRPATLLTPRLPFQEGSKVMLNQEGEESRAMLGQRLANTASFNHFQFERQMMPTPTPPLEPNAESLVSGAFDALWHTL